MSRNLEISCECTWIGRGRFEIWKQSLHEASLVWLVIGEFWLCLRKKYLDLSNDYKFTCVKRVSWRALKHAKRKYSSTLDNFSLSSQQLVLSYILYPCKCPEVHLQRSLAQFGPWLTPDIIPCLAHWIFPSKVNRNKNFRLQNDLLFFTDTKI